MSLLDLIAHASRLEGTDPRWKDFWAAVAKRDGAPKFGISEGLRDLERQKKMVAEGKSQTMNSRHLHGGATDIHLFDEEGNVTWDFPRYEAFWNEHVAPTADEMGLPIEWGGNWKTLKDGVHFQVADSKKGPGLLAMASTKTPEIAAEPDERAWGERFVDAFTDEDSRLPDVLQTVLESHTPPVYQPMAAPTPHATKFERPDYEALHRQFSQALPWASYMPQRRF